MNSNAERIALANALEALSRTPENERLHQAATDIHSTEAINNLRGLIEGDFARLNIGTEEKQAAKGVEEAVVQQLSPEQEEASVDEDSRLTEYKTQYEALSNSFKAKLTWAQIREKLLANNGEKLRKLQAMRDGGKLIGIEGEGEHAEVIFRDSGVEPVMYGYNKQGELLEIFDRNSEDFKAVQSWANYGQIRTKVLDDGYELFTKELVDAYYPTDENNGEDCHYKDELFVASGDGNEWRRSWLESGDNPSVAVYADFDPDNRRVNLYDDGPNLTVSRLGVVRLLRV